MSSRRARSSVNTTERHRIERAIELYLRQCYREHTVARVSELAQCLGANRTYLSRIVMHTIGVTLGEALRRRQLSFAARLVSETPLTMSEIAAAAAFGTERTFFRAFRKYYGMTPGSYREKATKCR